MRSRRRAPAPEGPTLTDAQRDAVLRACRWTYLPAVDLWVDPASDAREVPTQALRIAREQLRRGDALRGLPLVLDDDGALRDLAGTLVLRDCIALPTFAAGYRRLLLEADDEATGQQRLTTEQKAGA